MDLRVHCRANSAYIRRQRPDSGPGFQVKVLKPLKVFPPRSTAVGFIQRLRDEETGREFHALQKGSKPDSKFSLQKRLSALQKRLSASFTEYHDFLAEFSHLPYTATSQPPLFSGFGPKLILTGKHAKSLETLLEIGGVKARKRRDASCHTLRFWATREQLETF